MSSFTCGLRKSPTAVIAEKVGDKTHVTMNDLLSFPIRPLPTPKHRPARQRRCTLGYCPLESIVEEVIIAPSRRCRSAEWIIDRLTTTDIYDTQDTLKLQLAAPTVPHETQACEDTSQFDDIQESAVEELQDRAAEQAPESDPAGVDENGRAENMPCHLQATPSETTDSHDKIEPLYRTESFLSDISERDEHETGDVRTPIRLRPGQALERRLKRHAGIFSQSPSSGGITSDRWTLLEQDFVSRENYLREMMLPRESKEEDTSPSRLVMQATSTRTTKSERSHFEHDKRRLEDYWQTIKRSLVRPRSTLVIR